ncbi:hypothetical protein PORY_001201 [Pneumocystis oryctolagi]|uniref:Uncharacterized protein n=1 Tax=Pneumocystis oryctolagi TaxID=42067 RepID=A0ACB7CDS2_9ASCO|nr:hypothetical protein PORY_001201 [Pneumocystis oryctolagi]
MNKNNDNSSKEKQALDKVENPSLDVNKQQKKSINGVPRRRNYFIIYDPELAPKEYSKGRKAIYRFDGEADPPLVIEDPRLKIPKYGREKSRGRKTYRSSLINVVFDFDENSIGPDPPSQILVSNLSTLTTSENISMHFKTFGDIQELEIQVNPMTGASLGLCRIRYRKNQSNKLQGHHAAKNAVEKGNGMKIGTQIIKVQYDEDGVKCKTIIEELSKKTSLANSSTFSDRHSSMFSESSKKREEDYKNSDLTYKKSTSRDHRYYDSYSPDINDARINSKAHGRSRSLSKSPRLYNKYSQDSDSDFEKLQDRTYETMLSSTDDILKKINKKPYIFISERWLPLNKFSISDLEKHLSKHDWTDICVDKKGFYIIFKDNRSAQNCFVTMNQTHIYQYRITMDFHKSTPIDVQNTKFKNSFQPVNSVAEATNIVIKELMQVFMRDLKIKIIGPIIYESLDPSRFSPKIKDIKNSLTTKINNIRLNETKQDILNDNSVVSDETKKVNDFYSKINDPSFNSISKRFSVLPKFKKRVHENTYKNESLHDTFIRPKNVDARPLHHRLNEYSDSHDSSTDSSDTDHLSQDTSPSDLEKDNDISIKDYKNSKKKISNKKSSRLSRLRDYTSSDDESVNGKDNFLEQFHKRDEFGKNMQKYMDYKILDDDILDETKLKQNKRRNIDFTSSGEEDSSDIFKDTTESIQSSKSESYEDELSEYEEKPKRKKYQKRSKKNIKTDKINITNNEHIGLNLDHPVSFTSSEILVSDDDVDTLLDICGIQNIVKDEEDFMFLLEALETVESAEIDNIALWAWRKKELRPKNIDEYSASTKLFKDGGYNKINKSGSARTEGYFTITDAEKSLYLPLRNKAIIPIDSSATSITSRMNRINNRRLAVGIEMQKKISSNETDILRFNALKVRKKQLKFSKSPIHNWGLYAMEHIDMGDMVIEYVGEIIRQTVADIRERQYERQGIGSSYLFRIDDDTVVDATKKGNIARFINHSCDPSCTAKIIRVEGEKKIVIYAHRDIEKGEEITYDYKFPIEDVKIPCLCGAKTCRGTLN